MHCLDAELTYREWGKVELQNTSTQREVWSASPGLQWVRRWATPWPHELTIIQNFTTTGSEMSRLRISLPLCKGAKKPAKSFKNSQSFASPNLTCSSHLMLLESPRCTTFCQSTTIIVGFLKRTPTPILSWSRQAHSSDPKQLCSSNIRMCRSASTVRSCKELKRDNPVKAEPGMECS